MYDFAKWVSVGHSFLVRAQALSYSNRLNCVFVDVPSYCEHLSGYYTCMSDNGHSRHSDEAGSNVEGGDSTPRP